MRTKSEAEIMTQRRASINSIQRVSGSFWAADLTSASDIDLQGKGGTWGRLFLKSHGEYDMEELPNRWTVNSNL